MRYIHTHSPRGQDPLRISADDTPFRGGATCRYVVEGFDTGNNRSARKGGFVPRFKDLSVIFDSSEGSGVSGRPDGVTLDALLAICVDHLKGLQAGSSGSVDKQLAVDYIDSARGLLAQDTDSPHGRFHTGTFQNSETWSL